MRREVARQTRNANRISIHAPLTGCDLNNFNDATNASIISIHAPLTGCDCHKQGYYNSDKYISIHAPLTGCDPDHTSTIALIIFDFNPRTPYGMRLVPNLLELSDISHFNPRTPYGMRQ